MVTIDQAIAVLERAKHAMGGDRILTLSLTNSELDNVDVSRLVVMHEPPSGYVEVRVLHSGVNALMRHVAKLER